MSGGLQTHLTPLGFRLCSLGLLLAVVHGLALKRLAALGRDGTATLLELNDCFHGLVVVEEDEAETTRLVTLFLVAHYLALCRLQKRKKTK
jgi:hypothetical protein